MKQLQKQLVEFYVQFHQHQHYFLCHDILEDVWKSQSKFTKNDPIVALILIATGCYHHRRENYIGAHRSFQKAIRLLQRHSASDFVQLGVHHDLLYQTLEQFLEHTEQKRSFSPLILPLTNEMTETILKYEPEYRPLTKIISTPMLIHHHKLRDRSDVISARQQAQQNKKR